MGMRRKYAVCFVDDDPDELARFKKCFGSSYFVGVGKNFQRAVNDLRRTYTRKPDLFVLDMYFPTKVNTDTERDNLNQKWENFCVANNELRTVLASMEQTIVRRLAERAKSQRAPFVFFTRKGNLVDAIEAYEHIRALSVIKKPDPPIPGKERSKLEIKSARDKAMKELADQIKEKIDLAMNRASPSLSGQAFVAMSFARKLNAAYSNGIKPAIRSAGYKPMIIRMKEHANKIDEEIIDEIRKSTFLIADLTCHRGGVYFEAGIAKGYGVPVIWSCRKDDLKNLHFDIRQFNCIDWRTPDELATRLKRRIVHVLGQGPISPKG
jgi:hypothetical protein